MEDRNLIIDQISTLFRLVDQHRWGELETVFADSVQLDYTALQGGEPATLGAGEVVAGWRDGLEAIDAHQHLVANHLVTADGDAAVVTAAFLATHQWQDDTWMLGGDYRFELERRAGNWTVTAMTMAPVWQTGDPQLIATAMAGDTDDGEGGTPRNDEVTDTFSLDDRR